MRIASFCANGAASFGIVANNGVIDVPRHRPKLRVLADLLSEGFDDLAGLAATASADLRQEEIQLLPPVVAPPRIICVGVNYADRNEEYRDQSGRPRFPSIFFRSTASMVGHGAALQRPRESEQFDYEGEIALVIGRGGRRIARQAACDHIAGLTLANDGSVRDWMRHGKFNVTQGKNFDRSGSLGPWLVTTDEFPRFDNLRLTTRVNGELRQDDSTARLIFPFDYLIEYVSTFMALLPGDIILTGTPSGAGARLDPPVYLQSGDRVQIEVAEIGLLENTVIDDTDSGA
ncbi:MAG: fumarylacetoacetate hydrolase family protein [Steroidobacteraceae bacterium]